MTDILSYFATAFKPASSVQDAFAQKDASSAQNLIQYFEPSFNEGTKVSGDIFSSPDESASSENHKFVKYQKEDEPLVHREIPFLERDEAPQEHKPVYNTADKRFDKHVENGYNTPGSNSTATNNMDPLRYVDMQLALLDGLVQAKQGRLRTKQFDPKNNSSYQSAMAAIDKTDDTSFRKAEQNVKVALDREARYAKMSGTHVTVSGGDENYDRQVMIADRYKQLEDFKRHFG